MACRGPCKVYQWMMDVQSIIIAVERRWTENIEIRNPDDPREIRGYRRVEHDGDPCPTQYPDAHAIDVVRTIVGHFNGYNWKQWSIGCAHDCRCEVPVPPAVPEIWSHPLTGQFRTPWSTTTANELYATISYTVRVGMSVTNGECKDLGEFVRPFLQHVLDHA